MRAIDSEMIFQRAKKNKKWSDRLLRFPANGTGRASNGFVFESCCSGGRFFWCQEEEEEDEDERKREQAWGWSAVQGSRCPPPALVITGRPGYTRGRGTTHHWRPRQRHLGWAGVAIHSSHALTAADSYNRPHTHLLIHKSAYGPDALSLYHLAHKRTHLYALILTLFLARTHTGSFYLTHTHTHVGKREPHSHSPATSISSISRSKILGSQANIVLVPTRTCAYLNESVF